MLKGFIFLRVHYRTLQYLNTRFTQCRGVESWWWWGAGGRTTLGWSSKVVLQEQPLVYHHHTTGSGAVAATFANHFFFTNTLKYLNESFTSCVPDHCPPVTLHQPQLNHEESQCNHQLLYFPPLMITIDHPTNHSTTSGCYNNRDR